MQTQQSQTEPRAPLAPCVLTARPLESSMQARCTQRTYQALNNILDFVARPMRTGPYPPQVPSNITLISLRYIMMIHHWSDFLIIKCVC